MCPPSGLLLRKSDPHPVGDTVFVIHFCGEYSTHGLKQYGAERKTGVVTWCSDGEV